MTRISDMHKQWMKEPQYRKAYAALEDEFAIARAVIAARNRAGLTQSELARKMGTTQPVVARMESGRVQPSSRPCKDWRAPPAARSKSDSNLAVL